MRAEFIPPHHLRLKDIPKGRFLLACSGGVDSVVLFDLLILSEVDFEVAHVNHGLRGQDSQGDEEFVRSLCAEYSVPFHLHRETPKHFPGNIQENARLIRYKFFHEVLTERKLQWLLTAHHADDQAETLLMNLARGAGLRGLAGIPARRHTILRPLLNVQRRHILEYAKFNNLSWREDVSNRNLEYKRNALRIEVMPNLRRIFPDFLDGISKSVTIVNHLMDAVDQLVQMAGLRQDDPYGPRFPQSPWMETEYASYLLFHMVQPLGFSEAQCSQALRALLKGKTGRSFKAPGGVMFVERGYLQVYVDLREVSGLAPLLPQYPVRTPLGRLYFKYHNQKFPASAPSSFVEKVFLRLAPDQQLYVRTWKAGDVFAIPGGHRRKISDLLTDHKVPSGLKSVYPVVVNESDEIVWVPGLSLDPISIPAEEKGSVVVLALSRYVPMDPLLLS
ncbi:MAG: tRNA lysidine(34) synthetase TilS [Flavobacteriales bacterium]|nr:tRNA lysidine(34) synthetase TilS [Flavobacteriales bacterium]MCX7769039.1 tRNA lysidine(34) synthetase TilS [Flavobacteriales bacterium]MDW8410758.1 tRNA lysidine(34) synthetase TilS [Flavobacteriales bacterium]